MEMHRSVAHRFECALARKRGSTARRLAAVAVVPVVGLTALTVSASAATYGPYYIRAATSGACMDVRGGPSATANFTVVQQWSCWGGTNQHWYLQDTGDGQTYYVMSRNSGRCLDVKGGPGAITNGTALQIWDCWGGSNQKWYLNRAADGATFTTMRAANSGTCADITGGPGAVANYIPLQIWDCWGGTNQAWYLTTF